MSGDLIHPTVKLLCLVGPTASGKSDLAVEVARRSNAEVISVDASQVYRGFDIGTGKISEEEMRGVPHHLIDCVDPDERFDAGVFVERVDQLINEIDGRGRKIVLCGGTGLYFKALIQGLCEAPTVHKSIESRIEERLRAEGVEALHSELAIVDPTAAEKIMPRDKQRIGRALGVFLSHGVPLSDLQAQHQFSAERYQALILGLDPPREVLNERIAQRVKMMWEGGFLDEVQHLQRHGFQSALRSMGAIGYRLALSALEGEITRTEAQEKMLYATRQYARRQRRYFDRQLPTVWIEPAEGEIKVHVDQLSSALNEWWPDRLSV